MSYAAAAKHAPAADYVEPTPDTSLLSTHQEPTESDDLRVDDDKVHVVDADTANSLREAIEHADEPEAPSERFEHARDESRKELNDAEKATKKAAADARREASAAASEAKSEAKDVSAEAKKDAKAVADKAKKLAGQAEKKGEEAYGKAKAYAGEAEEEISKAAKKAAKKGRELEKDARDAAKRYPIAASGLIGAFNFAVLAGVGYAAYSNWDYPRWDRRTVSAVTVGVLGLFAGEGYLGYYEYEQDKKSA